MKSLPRNQSGFTIIELVVVIIILCILGTLVALTYSGVQASNRDKQRQADIETLQSKLEIYHAQNDKYPSLGEINNPAWRAEHMPELKEDTLKDPRWSDNGSCAQGGQPILGAGEHCYQYAATGADGAACDNAGVPCAQYTLTATLEDNQPFVKASLN
ncbi:MAG: type II secretion system protein [Candidatus Saccharimonadales bacterium]